MRLARETWLLLTIGLVDLASTLYLIHRGLAREANPVMAWYLVHFGWWAFCAAKTTMLVCPLVILEWARRIKPYLGLWALRIALVGYLFVYLGIVWRANEAHIDRITGAYLCRMSQLWQQRLKPSVPADQHHRPMMMPIE
jgi:hypothetical protein